MGPEAIENDYMISSLQGTCCIQNLISKHTDYMQVQHCIDDTDKIIYVVFCPPDLLKVRVQLLNHCTNNEPWIFKLSVFKYLEFDDPPDL